MTPLSHTLIHDWHAHVYFNASSKAAAWALREAIALGFPQVVGWLALNHGLLDVFIHPNTGDGLRDHRDRALWIGKPHVLELAGFEAQD